MEAAVLTKKDIGELLKISESTVRKMDINEELPSALCTNCRIKRWSSEDIRLWIRWGSPSRDKFNAKKSERE